MLYGVEYESRKIGSLNCDEVAEEPLYCGGCGQKVDEIEPCTWDVTLQVGACCRLHSDEHPELVFGPENRIWEDYQENWVEITEFVGVKKPAGMQLVLPFEDVA